MFKEYLQFKPCLAHSTILMSNLYPLKKSSKLPTGVFFPINTMAKLFCIDTNYLIRFLTNDIPSQAQKTKQIITKHQVFIPTIVFAETVYILNNHYQVKKNKIFSTFLSLFKQPNITHPPFILQAINIYNQENISFYDCLILAESIEKKLPLKTFDQKLQKAFKRYR